MSDPNINSRINVSQSNRWYRWRTNDSDLLRQHSVRDISMHSANMHMIPANDEIRKKLLSVKRGQKVVIRGHLVNVSHPDFNGQWRSSMTRNDTGDGACEIVLVTKIEM